MWLIASRIVALPLIAGLAYEVIRLAAALRALPARARGARAGPVAAAPDDARAHARPGRRLDPRARARARGREKSHVRLGPRVEVMA